MFKNKSAFYDLYRPNYPYSLVIFLKEQMLLKNNYLVAEFGSGTGKLTGLLLENGNRVYGIEQDEEMQDFLSKKFSSNPNFKLIKKSAEDSKLPKRHFDLIIAAQSFHLFNPVEAKKEFYRILKPKGNIVLIWYHWNQNQKITHEIRSLFYKFKDKQKQQVRTQVEIDFFKNLFYPNTIHHEVIDTIKQKFLRTEFISSMLSSSYATEVNNPLHTEYLREVEYIFSKFSESGYIEYSFDIEIFFLKVE